MKRKIIICIVSVLMLILFANVAFADEIKTSMSGPDILRANDTLKVVYTAENLSCYGFQGNITYNSDIMTLVSAKALHKNWVIELLGDGRFIAYTKTPLDPESEFNGGEIFALEFLISSKAEDWTTVSVSFTDVIATDAQEETVVPDAHYQKAVSPPLSGDASIAALYITNASYSPAFSPDVTEYTVPMGVGYDVTSLDITLVTSNEKAVYEISGNSLEVGNNTVTINVTAENGNVKEYTITLKRAHSPTDRLSDNTRLTELNISSGTLSPAFSPDIRDYIVYLPNEIKEFTANGIAEDQFAKEVMGADVSLVTGVNIVKVCCRAEDGSVGDYNIQVVVMPEYIGIVPTINNTIPLVGTVDIFGEYELGKPVKAVLSEGYEGSSFTVNWYRNKELVAMGEEYLITDADKESIITVELVGKGFFSGMVSGPRLVVLKNGEVLPADGYIPTESFNLSSFAIIAVGVIAFSLTGGIMIGSFREKRVAASKKNDTH